MPAAAGSHPGGQAKTVTHLSPTGRGDLGCLGLALASRCFGPTCHICFRSDGSLVVCDKDGNEKVLAPPNCGAAVVYRIGYYNIVLPKTAHSEETLFVVLVNFYWMMQFNSCFAKGGCHV